MSLSWKSGVARSLIGLAFAFFCGGIYLHKAKQFAGITPTERTTTAQDVQVHHHIADGPIDFIARGFRFDYYSCDYDFSVDGNPYSGHANCSQTGLANATVYYDPADPSLSSLTDFSAMGVHCYRIAVSCFGIGILIVLSAAFIALLTANEKKAKGGVVVDATGTVIYPGEMSFNSRFGGLPQGNRNAEESNVAARVEAANVPASASSSRLRELYLEVVNEIHPDRAANERDLALRERLMKEANAAFEHGDAGTLRRVLEEYRSVTPAS